MTTASTSATRDGGPSTRSLRGLDWVNFFLADVQTGVGAFLAIYLAASNWNEQRVGLALTVGGIAGIIAQTPAGGLIDRLRRSPSSHRSLANGRRSGEVSRCRGRHRGFAQPIHRRRHRASLQLSRRLPVSRGDRRRGVGDSVALHAGNAG